MNLKIEVLVFFILSLYLLILLLRLFKSIIKEIRKAAKQAKLEMLQQRHTRIMEGLPEDKRQHEELEYHELCDRIDAAPEDGIFYRKASRLIKGVFSATGVVASIAAAVISYLQLKGH